MEIIAIVFGVLFLLLVVLFLLLAVQMINVHSHNQVAIAKLLKDIRDKIK